MSKERSRYRGAEQIQIPPGGIELFDPRNSLRRNELPSSFSFHYLSPIMNDIYRHSYQQTPDEPALKSQFSHGYEPQFAYTRRLRRTREGGVNTYVSPDGSVYAAPIVIGTEVKLAALDEQLYELIESGNYPYLQMHSHPIHDLGMHSIGDWTNLVYKRLPQPDCQIPLLNASCVLGADAQVLAVMTKESHNLIDDEDHDTFQFPWRQRLEEASGDAGEQDQIRLELVRHMGAWMYFSTDKTHFRSMPPGQIMRRLRSLEAARLRRAI